MKHAVHYSSKKHDWETPTFVFDDIQNKLKIKFDLDPCATKKNAKCKKFFTKEMDGLTKKWTGNVFMNPPYGKEIHLWVKKAYESVKSGDAKCVVGLLPARTDTRWFHEYMYQGGDVYFIRGRIKFSGHKNSAPFPSMIVVWRTR